MKYVRTEGNWDFQAQGLFIGIIAFILLLFSGLYLDIYQQAILAYSALFITFILSRFKTNSYIRVVVLSIGTFLALKYWFFRTFHTLGYNGFFDFLAMMALYLAETYSILVFLFGAFVSLHPINRKPPPLPKDKSKWPTVDVFIPTYNEPIDIVKTTVIACKQIRYPPDKLQIYILDDGGTVQKRTDPDPEKAKAAWERYEQLKALAKELGVNYITREKNVHAKAGNINNALRLTSKGYYNRDTKEGEWYCYGIPPKKGGEIVVIFDCDHVPTVDFLENTVGFFLQDKKLFLVQTPHFFINPIPPERSLNTFYEAPSENEMFYAKIQKGLDFWNASFFCGSAALFRREVMERVGGISGQTITEDAETALGLHAMGYHSVYLDKPMVCGLSPELFDDFLLQRSRWAQGMIQIFILKNPLLQKGLKWYQKIAYINSNIFWFFPLVRTIYLIAPILYLIFGLKVYNVSYMQIISYTIPYVLNLMLISNYLYGRYRPTFFSEVYEITQSLFLIPSVIGVLLSPKKPTFKVTPKGVSLEKDYINPKATIFWLFLLINAFAIYKAIERWYASPLERGTIVVTTAWTILNMIMLILAIGALYEPREVRRYHRFKVKEWAIVEFPRVGKRFKAMVQDISMGGLGLLIKDREVLNYLRTGEEVRVKTYNYYERKFFFPVKSIKLDKAKKSQKERGSNGNIISKNRRSTNGYQ